MWARPVLLRPIFAGVVYRYYACFPSMRGGFDSRRPHQACLCSGNKGLPQSMSTSLPSEHTLSFGRRRTMRLFLLISVVAGAVGLGAKLFDLLVVATAWGASPPTSFAHLPYGKEFPIDPGTFFQPLSALWLIGIIGALISGWKCSLRFWLILPVVTFTIIWIFTPTVFWPMINQLWSIHKARITMTEIEQIALVHRWFIWDSFRIILIAIGFFSSLRALTGPVFTSKDAF